MPLARLILLSGLAAVPSLATAACSLSLPAAINLAAGGYGPALHHQSLSVPITVAIRSDGTACDWLLGVAEPAGRVHQLDGPGAPLPLSLTTQAGGGMPLRDLPLAGSGEMQSGSSPAGGASTTLWVNLSPQPGRPPGVYSTTVRLNLYAPAGGTAPARLVDAQTLRLDLTVPVWLRAQLLVEGQLTEFGVARQIDFGELVPGLVREVQIQVSGNVRHSFSTLAELNSRLMRRHVDFDSGLSFVPYRLDNLGITTASGITTYRQRLTIGDTSAANPGDYSGGLVYTIAAL